jgi:hypothetical protein
MWKLRRMRRGSELEANLRSRRSEARAEFVADLSQRVLAEPFAPRSRRTWSRVAFAAAASTFILGTFASFGGVGYAASGAKGTYHAVKQVTVKHTLIVSVQKSSASDQYAPKPKPHKKPKKQPKKHATGGVAGERGAVGVAGVRTSGTLPFTGLSLATTLVLSLALIVTGLALRRRERRSN